ncbi:hypothetical protein D3C81_1343960 [compost metagenome]
MHRPHADSHRHAAARQPHACSDTLAARNARGHVERGIGSKDGNNEGDDNEDLVVLANQHGGLNSFSVRGYAKAPERAVTLSPERNDEKGFKSPFLMGVKVLFNDIRGLFQL